MLCWIAAEAVAGAEQPGRRRPQTPLVPAVLPEWSDLTMMTFRPFSRRDFMNSSFVAAAAALHYMGNIARAGGDLAGEPDLPLVDLHAHLDHSSLEQVLPLGRQRKVRLGIVEHAGTRENKYPVVLSTDAELLAYLKMLDGQGVYKGVQAEWTDWMSCFSPEVLAQLDYVLTDAMTFPGKNGQRVKLWEPAAADQVDMHNHEHFMDRFVDWHVQIMSTEPFDILANASWLPDALMNEYETLWTERRVQKVVDAALKFGVAIEISASYKLPHLAFLKLAKSAGVKFSFGSNGRYPNMGKLDYSIAMAKALGLEASDVFLPGDTSIRAVVRRRV
jgi:histidinol phosphatase-like PHP family hydrolase